MREAFHRETAVGLTCRAKMTLEPPIGRYDTNHKARMMKHCNYWLVRHAMRERRAFGLSGLSLLARIVVVVAVVVVDVDVVTEAGFVE